MRVRKTKGLSATVSGMFLPPWTPQRITSKVSRAYKREQDGQTDSRRLPHR
ncbi:MAG: hypothetical protein E6Y21_12640 [Cutibacterium avidum]|nr:hypothetical protein [Cutibacterium avidum]MDU4681329.1 hypothetical protein [Cutibacterium avidum]